MLLQYPQPERSRKKIRIKLEVDTNPPLGATTEIKYLDFPLSFSIQTKDLASSFAGKLHALLCRSYLKGRDWYDFIWYVAKRAPVNYLLLSKAIEQNGPWQGQDIAIDKAWLIKKLAQKIKSVTWHEASEDVARFLKPREQESLALWSEDFFMSRLAKLEDNLL